MKKTNKFTILSVITIIVLIVSSFSQADKPNTSTNLKVLPKNISHEDLSKIMKGYNAALGVKCNHCHASKTNGEKGLDFASDANPNKNIARSMIKMTNKINKKYFNHQHEGLIQNISCETCHNGNAKAKTITLR